MTLCRLLRACVLAAAFVALQWPAWAAAQGDRSARGFVWEASRGRDRVLLLGTIHVGRPDTASVAEMAPLKTADVYAFEANVFDAQASLAATQRWAMYPAGRPGLEAHVDAATLARVEAMSARHGGMPLCCRMKPWMVANTLVVLEAVDAGFSPAYGSEAQLHQLALSSGKPIVEIEGFDEQLRLFDEAPPDTQRDYLRHTLETIENGSGRGEIERLVDAWQRGDDAAMERMVADMMRSDSPARRFLAERIFRARHPKMVAAIDRYATSGRLHVVAIGALHYFGPEGLLQLLRDRGFAVKRLG